MRSLHNPLCPNQSGVQGHNDRAAVRRPHRLSLCRSLLWTPISDAADVFLHGPERDIHDLSAPIGGHGSGCELACAIVGRTPVSKHRIRTPKRLGFLCEASGVIEGIRSQGRITSSSFRLGHSAPCMSMAGKDNSGCCAR
jgi:hypothetical protein